MMDISIKEKINLEQLKSIVAKYCQITEDKIVITDDIEQILEIDNKDRDSLIWINLINRKYGDFKITLEIFKDERKFGSYINFAKAIAMNTKQQVLSDFDKKREYGQWVLIDCNGCEHIVKEDISVEYPDNEDGVTLTSEFQYLLKN